MTKRNKSCESEVMLTMQRKELLKKSAIRYAEYYGMVEVQDALYADSASEKDFHESDKYYRFRCQYQNGIP